MEDSVQEKISIPEWEMLPDIGLYMDQVVTLAERIFYPRLPKGETTRSMINNYVKSGLVPRPVGKKYDRDHLARLIMVCVLKQALNLDSIGLLLDGLCREGIREGYDRFRTKLNELERAVEAGRISLSWETETPGEEALSSGIMAALCTIHTYRVLDRLQAAKKED